MRKSGRNHGWSKTPTYKSWMMMRERCYRESHEHYHYYGGRGIGVCERWRESFENFLADMGERPRGHTLDREDPDKDYTPENCRWATKETQANNTRGNHYLTIDGETKSLSQWARDKGVSMQMLWQRVKRGVPEHRLFEGDMRYTKRTHCKNGHELTEENVYLRPDGFRVCKQCRRAWKRKYSAEKRAA